jgi:hypothetical protein
MGDVEMNHSTGPVSPKWDARWAAMYELGCIACRKNGFTHKTVAEIHHFLSGNKRIGHHATVPLCPWHHTATFDGTNTRTMLALMGPSWHKHRRDFRARYGSDEALLAEVNELIGEC